MMNAECGMMNDERHAASHSSFRIQHSSFAFSRLMLAEGSRVLGLVLAFAFESFSVEEVAADDVREEERGQC